MRAGEPDEAPRPRHDPVGVVAAAAGRQPAAAGVSVRDGDRRAAPPRPSRSSSPAGGRADPRRASRRRAGTRRRPARTRRPARGASARTAASHGPSPVPGSSGTLTDVPAAAPSPSSSTKPVPGNRYRPDLVERERQDARIRPVDRLDAVAVVDVEVDVQDPQPVAPRPGDRERRVVVDAEARRPVGHRVVEPAARVEGVLDVAAQDRLDRPERAAGDRRARLVHARERRDRRRPRRSPPSAGPYGSLGEALDDLDVAPRVAPQQLVVGCRLRREARLGADRAEQVDARAEPPRRQRMARPEVVRRGARPETSSMRGTIPAMERGTPRRHTAPNAPRARRPRRAVARCTIRAWVPTC